jgi:hypothetical protein
MLRALGLGRDYDMAGSTSWCPALRRQARERHVKISAGCSP